MSLGLLSCSSKSQKMTTFLRLNSVGEDASSKCDFEYRPSKSKAKGSSKRKFHIGLSKSLDISPPSVCKYLSDNSNMSFPSVHSHRDLGYGQNPSHRINSIQCAKFHKCNSLPENYSGFANEKFDSWPDLSSYKTKSFGNTNSSVFSSQSSSPIIEKMPVKMHLEQSVLDAVSPRVKLKQSQASSFCAPLSTETTPRCCHSPDTLAEATSSLTATDIPSEASNEKCALFSTNTPIFSCIAPHSPPSVSVCTTKESPDSIVSALNESSCIDLPSRKVHIDSSKLPPCDMKTEAMESTPKTSADLTYVLFSPRKTCKKGRPSTRKQKKRQRHKQKSANISFSVSVDNSKNGSNSSFQDSISKDSELTDISPPPSHHSPLHSHLTSSPADFPSTSTPTKKQAPPSSAFFLFFSSSDSESSEEDDESCSQWDTDGISGDSYDACGLDIALNFDSLFKKKQVPSLHNVMGTAEDSDDELRDGHGEECLSLSLRNPKTSPLIMVNVSVSENDDWDDSVDFSASPTPSGQSSCIAQALGLTAGLFLDDVLKISQNSPKNTNTDLRKSEKLSTEAADQHDISKVQSDSLIDINLKWNENYPNAGFRACSACNGEVVDNPLIKVRFAEEPGLFSVHMVGNEDRAGTWRLDNERFERRIKEAAKVLSPILTSDHRRKIEERNAKLNTIR